MFQVISSAGLRAKLLELHTQILTDLPLCCKQLIGLSCAAAGPVRSPS